MAISSYNKSRHNSSIGKSPYEAFFGRSSRAVADVALNHPLLMETKYKNVNQYLVKLWDNANRIQSIIRTNQDQARLKQQAQYEKAVHEKFDYNVGDKVKISGDWVIGKSLDFR